jgi:hypothetical protein
MNIFAIENNKAGDIDWIKSAQSQDNYRVVKMILESCQILSTVLNEQGIKAPYRSFNPKHPSCLWAAESSDNFTNLVIHCAAMIEEYEDRFNKIHKCKAVLNNIINLFDASKFITDKPTPLKMAMPNNFRSDNIVESYRRFYASKPRIRYPRNKIPSWFNKYRKEKTYQII